MTDGPFREPASPADGAEPHPFGYGRWRCPGCGVFDPTVVRSAAGVALKHLHIGCRHTWYTRTYEAERARRAEDLPLYAPVIKIFAKWLVLMAFGAACGWFAGPTHGGSLLVLMFAITHYTRRSFR